MTSMTRHRRGVRHAAPLAAALSLVLLLAACSVKLPGSGAPPDLYTLTPKSTYSSDLPTVDTEITRLRGHINPGLVVLRPYPPCVFSNFVNFRQVGTGQFIRLTFYVITQAPLPHKHD